MLFSNYFFIEFGLKGHLSMEKFAFENYPTIFWENDQYKNISFRCVTTENYPILLFVEGKGESKRFKLMIFQIIRRR